MSKSYSKRAKKSSRCTARSSGEARMIDAADVLSGRVTVELPVSMAEIIGGVSAEIERLAGEAGLLIMQSVMNAEVESLAGPKGRHDPQRQATRWTSQPGYVVLGGKKVRTVKPRVRSMEGHEVTLTSYERFQSPPRRQPSIVRKLINGISTRKYTRSARKSWRGREGCGPSSHQSDKRRRGRGCLEPMQTGRGLGQDRAGCQGSGADHRGVAERQRYRDPLGGCGCAWIDWARCRGCGSQPHAHAGQQLRTAMGVRGACIPHNGG